MANELKIALILDKKAIFKWQADILDQLHQSDFATIDFILLPGNSQQDHLSPLLRFFQKVRQVFFLFHQKLDELLFSNGNSLMRSWKVEKLPKNIRKIDLTKVDIDLEALFHPLDIVLMFGRMKFENKIPDIPKYGIWDLTCQEDSLNTECLPGYWELVHHSPDLITNLRILGTNNQSRILYQSSQITDYFSIYKNHQKYLKRLKLITLRSVHKISEQGSEYLNYQFEKNGKSSMQSEGYKRDIPGMFSSVKNILLHLWFLLKDSFLQLVYSDYWFVLINTKKANAVFDEFKTIDSPKDRFWADPFVISRNGQHYIFVEELMYKTGKGRISQLEVDDCGEVQNDSIVLEKPYHLSYPFLFQHKGKDFMIPETKENRTIDLYVCEDFPSRWKFGKSIMTDIYAVDATPFYYEGKWWLFANVDETDGNSSINDELFLYYSDDLFSDNWVSHPKNPVVSDVKSARPAGKIYEEAGEIFRPSQDCSLRYGYALNINRVTKLSEDDYEEVLERKILPDWQPGIKRNHTINSSSKATVIDAFKPRSRFGV